MGLSRAARGCVVVFLVGALMCGCTKLDKHGMDRPVSISLDHLGTYETGVFDQSAAEIVAYHAGTKHLIFTNGSENGVTFLDISSPRTPEAKRSVRFHGGVNSVAVHGDVVAVAVAATKKQDPGAVVFLTPQGEVTGSVAVGALPDMVCFTPDGRYLLTANEGEPSEDYRDDPEGTVSIISMARGAERVGQRDVRTVRFRGTPLSGGVRITGPSGTLPERDLEPEYIAVTPDSRFAYVSLQENNAVAKIDIEAGRVEMVRGLGAKDHNMEGTGFDASKKDNGVRIRPWPVKGLFMPDAICAYEAGDRVFLVSANEGDGREYGHYSDEVKVKNLGLDPARFPFREHLVREQNLGGLVVSARDGDVDGDGDMDVLYSFGARSFSIWDEDLNLVFDSGSALETLVASRYPNHFNASNTKNAFDNRSPKKGPEPEGMTLGEIGGRTYAFVLLERVGGIVVYDITDPTSPAFKSYTNRRRFDVSAKSSEAGDLGPEGAVFISANESPNGESLLAVANEVSGTVSLYHVISK